MKIETQINILVNALKSAIVTIVSAGITLYLISFYFSVTTKTQVYGLLAFISFLVTVKAILQTILLIYYGMNKIQPVFDTKTYY